MIEGPGDDDDPFEGLSLDDEFVRDAKVREEAAAERIERLRRIDTEHRRLIDEARARQHALERTTQLETKRERRRPRLGVVVVVAILAAVIGWSLLFEKDSGSGSGDATARRDADEPTTEEPTTEAAAGRDLATGGTEVATWPSPSDEEQDAPLGTPAPLATESSAFRFGEIQPGTAKPVAYDPCRPIHVVHNPDGAPAGAETLVSEALADVQRATGLQLDLEGETDEAADLNREAFQPDRYGDRWAPVLVAWSDATDVPDLAGDVAGIGGSGWVEIDGVRVYVSGVVVLDAPDLLQTSDAEGNDAVTAVIRHELGHVVGLDHVQDETELMNPVGHRGVVTFGPGDLTGLAALGRGQCIPGV